MSKSCNKIGCTLKNKIYDDNDKRTECPLCKQPLTSYCKANEFDIPLPDAVIETVELIEIHSKKSIKIPLDGCVIEKNCDIGDGIFNHKYISDPHCRLSIEKNMLLIEDIGGHIEGSLNGTFINYGDRLTKKIPTLLKNGDILKIAHLKFDVKIKRAATPNPKPDDIIEEKSVLGWVVICKHCGEEYPVENENGKIQTCNSCTNTRDAKDIARVPAVLRKIKWRSETNGNRADNISC